MQDRAENFRVPQMVSSETKSGHGKRLLSEPVRFESYNAGFCLFSIALPNLFGIRNVRLFPSDLHGDLRLGRSRSGHTSR
jgi:hypothetical protein